MEARSFFHLRGKHATAVGALLLLLALRQTSHAEPLNPAVPSVAGTEVDVHVNKLVAYRLVSKDAPKDLEPGQWLGLIKASDLESYRQMYAIRREWNAGDVIQTYEVDGPITASLAEQQIDHDVVGGDTRFLRGGGIQIQLREGARATPMGAPSSFQGSGGPSSSEARFARLQQTTSATTPPGRNFASTTPPLPGCQ